jgi:two-component system LytT family response regulator
MTKINCIIVDDEAPGRIVLRELLTRFCPSVEILDEAENITDAYEKITRISPDLVLLDIQMPGGNGFELLKKFEKINFDIIFVTSFDKYAINAIKFSPLDYLLKPVDIKDLKESIVRVEERKKNKSSSGEWMMQLVNNMNGHASEKKMAFHHRDKVKLVKVSEIVCLEAESNYTHVHTCDDQKYTPARVLKDFEEYFTGLGNFFRISKSVIVNMDYVTGYSKGEPCMVSLKNGKEYEIGRRKKTELMERVKR